MQCIPEIQAMADQLTAWRRHFHQHPEPSLKEYQTAAKIQEILTGWGIPWQPVGETGTLGTIQGLQEPSDRVILLRADIDALEIQEANGAPYQSLTPGLMHACGHDGHTAALLGAAYYLHQHRDQFAGRVKLAFQQAEEIGAGAKQFVASGLIDDCQEVFGIHVDPSLPLGDVQIMPGPNMASCDIFTIQVQGQSSHVGRPHHGVDALLAGANIVTDLQYLVARQVDPLEGAVIGIGRFESGTRYNIVANSATIEGTLRTLSQASRIRLLDKIQSVAAAVAATHGAQIDFSNYDAAAPVVNHPDSARRARRIAEAWLGADHIHSQQPPSMGADDFADYLLKMPGVYIRVGTQSSPGTSYGLHHECFDLAEEALPLMASFHARYALDFLTGE